MTINSAALLIRHLPQGNDSGRLGVGPFTNQELSASEGCQRAYRHHQPGHRRDSQDLHPATDEEVDAAIARAYARFQDYRHNTTFAQRAQWANATADLLEKEADDVAAMMTLEMGKTLKSAKAEALKCAKGFRYYAENAEKLLADEPADAKAVGAKRAYIRYQPLGWCWP